MNRRQFCLSACAVAVVSTTSGCMTKSMWENIPERTQTDIYQDQINAFYISQNQNHFVILSDRFHYIFKTEQVIPILQSNLRNQYIVDIQDMRMPDPQGQLSLPIQGVLVFSLSLQNLNAQEQAQAKRLGFEMATPEQRKAAWQLAQLRGIKVSSTDDFLVRRIEIHGNRFQPQAGINYGNSQHFYRAYQVPVLQTKSSSSAAHVLGAAIVTPITVAADGVLFLLGFPLFLIGGAVLLSNY